ncbi:mitochondrial pyruvate carrier 2-like [Pectinophora gossypiella]|uniref:mitochondrial pyruvate carrier 2-like n=1 Tax=Pectinophora gossypiella TaxID=13191 RepID=UPI00214F5086|nr:mitochondrial pyruvate carrier 2-like [Pectinophora gossypiella]
MSAIYKRIIETCDKFVPNSMRPLWEHPAGPKTIFFWAPICKWGLVAAGIGDLNRPAESLSLRQHTSLAVTSLIWSRWSLVIIPKNYSLFAVNSFVAGTNIYQLCRIYNYEHNKSKDAKK